MKTRKRTAANELHKFDMDSVAHHKLLPSIYALEKLVPITIADLKKREPGLVVRLQAAPEFTELLGHKKALTLEDVRALEETLDADHYPVEKQQWSGKHMSQQKSGHKQIVLCIQADETTIEEMQKADCYDLFQQISQLSAQSGHPSCDNLLGFVRLDVAEDRSFVLVEEIQSDSLAAAHRLKHFNPKYEIELLEKHMPNMRGHFMEDQIEEMYKDTLPKVPALEELCSNFPEVAYCAAICAQEWYQENLLAHT